MGRLHTSRTPHGMEGSSMSPEERVGLAILRWAQVRPEVANMSPEDRMAEAHRQLIGLIREAETDVRREMEADLVGARAEIRRLTEINMEVAADRRRAQEEVLRMRKELHEERLRSSRIERAATKSPKSGDAA